MRACTALLLAVFCFSTTGCDKPQDPDLKITSFTHNEDGHTFTVNSTGPKNTTATAFVCVAINETQVNHISSLLGDSLQSVAIDYDSQGNGTVTILQPLLSGPYMIGVFRDFEKAITRVSYDPTSDAP